MGYTVPARFGAIPPVTINPAPPMARSAKNAASLDNPPTKHKEELFPCVRVACSKGATEQTTQMYLAGDRRLVIALGKISHSVIQYVVVSDKT